MFLDNFTCNIKILTVLKLNWNFSDTDAEHRNYHALSFRVKGNASFSYNNTTLSVRSGDILFAPENLEYHINAQDEELYVIHFILPDKKYNNLEVFRIEDYTKAQKLFNACLELWNKKEPGYQIKTMSVFFDILALITISSIQAETDDNHQKIEPAIEYLRTHFTQPELSVLTLCDLVHMSDTWFRKLFFKCYGTKPTKYINTLRINYAKELLESGYYTVEETAEMSGFENPKYFSTIFKQFTGCTPSKYRSSLYPDV